MGKWLLLEMVAAVVAILLVAGLLLTWRRVPASEPLSLEPVALSEMEQTFLLRLARRQLEAVLAGEPEISVEATGLSANLKREGACFVTLYKNGALRGCIIDTFYPHEPLYRNVLRNVLLAATADERFPPVTLDELEAIRIEISVLNTLRALSFAGSEDLVKKLTPGKDGVVLTTSSGRSTYLPQVWEVFPDPAEFLSRLCEKQGAAADCWKSNPRPQVETYRVLHFGEVKLPPQGGAS